MAFLLWTYTWLVAVHGHLRMEATTRLQDEVLVSEGPCDATEKRAVIVVAYYGTKMNKVTKASNKRQRAKC